MRKRYAHQVTVVVMNILLNRSYDESGSDMSIEDWIKSSSSDSPTFQICYFIIQCQKYILLFIRAHRESKLQLMIFALKKLVPLFFAMDHQNYARWVPIFIRDLENLPPDVQAQFETGNWTIRISNHRFSSMPIDQAHEQLNKRVKGVGGVIGLTESPFMLEKWAMTGPEIACVLSEFSGDSDDPEILPHHNEGFSSQKRFKEHVVDLLEVILANINPFDEHSQQLVTLDNKVCESPAASASVRTIDSLGKEQYTTYRKNVLDSNVTALSAPIKRNNLLLFHEVKIRKVSSVKLKVQHFKNQTDLFGKAFLMADSRGVQRS